MKFRRTYVVYWLSRQTKRRMLIFAVLVTLIMIVFSNQLPTVRTWTYWTLPLSGQVIVVDPGHGGADGGAQSQSGLHEKEVTLQIGLYLRDYLQQAGAVVYMTRETDKDLASLGTRGLSRRKTEDLKARAALVNEKNADVFISIHLNAFPSTRWFGPQTFYTENHAQNEGLAKLIQDELRTQLVNTHRQSKTIRGIYLLERTKVPAVLIEVGFISNPMEASRLAQVDYQQQLATAIYRGILRHASGERMSLVHQRVP